MLERARLLLNQHRPEEAEEMVRGYLVDFPNDAEGHVVLAWCLFAQEKPKESLKVANQAIGLAPHWDHVFYVKGTILVELNKFQEAVKCAQQAIKLDPEDADNFCLFGEALTLQKKWKLAIVMLRKGLTFDPQHTRCRNMLSHCLIQIGEKGLVKESLEAGLAQNPMNPNSHIQVGFHSLKNGDSERALQAFEEALRLNPDNKAARAGLVEALKARNPIYGWILRGFIRLGSLPGRTLFALLVGFYVLNRFASNLRHTHPDWEWFLKPFNWFYLAIVGITWFADSLFDCLLLVHRRGRHALVGKARTKAILFGIALIPVFTCVGIYLATGNDDWMWVGIFTLIGQIPVMSAFGSRKGAPRTFMTIIALLCNILIVSGYVMQIASGQIQQVVGNSGFATGGVAAAFSSWLGMIFMAMNSDDD